MQVLFSARLASDLSSWAKDGADLGTEWVVQLIAPWRNWAPGWGGEGGRTAAVVATSTLPQSQQARVKVVQQK